MIQGLKKRFSIINNRIASFEKNWTWATLALIGLTLVGLSWLQYYRFDIQAVDFSIFDQMIPNTSRGHFMVSAACGNCNHFGRHSTPILFLLYPFQLWVWHPLFLVTIHTLALASGSLPLYLLCRQKLSESWHRLAVLVCFFCSPFFIKIWEYQFHPEVFYVPLFLWFAYGLENKRWGLLWAIGALICSVKEDGAIYLGSAFLAAAITRKMSFKWAGAMIAFCACVFGINTHWIIPANSGLTQYNLAGTASRYGSSVGDFASGVLSHPGEVILLLIKGRWLSELFRFLFLPLLDLFFLVSVAPFALITSVASSDVMKGLATYYSAPYLPWVMISLVMTLSKERLPWIKARWTHAAKGYVLGFALVSSIPAWWPYHLPNSSVTRESFTAAREKLDLSRTICAQSAIFPQLGYPPGLELLGPECIAKRLDYYVLNRELNAWPYSGQDLDSMIFKLKQDRQYREEHVESFVIFSRNLSSHLSAP